MSSQPRTGRRGYIFASGDLGRPGRRKELGEDQMSWMGLDLWPMQTDVCRAKARRGERRFSSAAPTRLQGTSQLGANWRVSLESSAWLIL